MPLTNSERKNYGILKSSFTKVKARNPIFQLGETLNTYMQAVAFGECEKAIIEITGICGRKYIIEMREV
jgi:hypothetical protein